MVTFAHLGLAAVLVLFGAGACSSGQPTTAAPEVATLASPSTVASAAASPTPERPRRRLDDTAADEAALTKAFEKCMAEHGQVAVKGFAEGSGLPKELVKAQEACEKFWPLPPWELDPGNPEAKDFARDVVKCLKGKGVKNVDTGQNGIDIVAGDDSVTSTGKYLLVCQRQVATRGN